MQCKEALFSIASAISKPPQIDQATAALARPSVARVLVEHDVTQLLLQHIQISVGDSGFWQSVVNEKIPLYCASYKHLGHAFKTFMWLIQDVAPSGLIELDKIVLKRIRKQGFCL